MTYSALIFDLDGVIIDSEALHNAAVAAALQAHGVTLPASVFDEFMGVPDEVFLEAASQRYLNSTVSATQLLAEKQQVFLQTQSQVAAVPGAVAFIHSARPHYAAFALATSSLRLNQQLAFTKLGLDGIFDAIVTAEDVEHTKPHPEPYLRAVAALATPADQCLVIEDSRNGIYAARAAGCDVVGLTTSYPAHELAEAGATYICTSFEEIAALLAAN